ncbi:MAG: hypothetical protein WAU82_21485 [Candidatus Binatus sp.]|uniref:hypothetical protein n=1 Tax=Candidatus Binatus sp. TaxID=2811406 RepID=UPI003BB0E4EE
MKPRHAAALALVGWYLMTPQFNLEGKFDTSLPLSKWMMTGPVASQQECEHRRLRSFKLLDDPAIRKQLKPDIPKLRAEAARRWPNQKFPAETEKDYFDSIRKSFELSQCVSDDDPRLKGN